MSTCVPGVVLELGTSRHLPAPTALIAPLVSAVAGIAAASAPNVAAAATTAAAPARPRRGLGEPLLLPCPSVPPVGSPRGAMGRRGPEPAWASAGRGGVAVGWD